MSRPARTCPHADREHADNLRLVLGLGRSGTSWLAHVLGKADNPMRFLIEPLYGMENVPVFSQGYDQTALPYLPKLEENHPLLKYYEGWANPNWSGEMLPEKLIRDDRDFSVCLIKEVHSLLATEGLLKALRCPTIFITRNPLYVVDSLFATVGLDAPIWYHESHYIQDFTFLSCFCEGERLLVLNRFTHRYESNREWMITRKALTVTLLNRMLTALSDEFEHAMHIQYEELCRQPKQEFMRAFGFLGLEMGEEAKRFLKETQSVKDAGDPYSIYRDTASQVNRPLKFLTEKEAVMVQKVLDGVA